jgi:IS1 family transposase
MGDVVEMDEWCIRFSPALWLWIAVSRSVGLVLAFVMDDRSDEALFRLLDEEMPPGWREETVVCTDAWGAYSRLLPPALHQVCSKESGKTSKVEALNTKWRQRQSGFVRRFCTSLLWCLLANRGRSDRAVLDFGGAAQSRLPEAMGTTVQKRYKNGTKNDGTKNDGTKAVRLLRYQTHSPDFLSFWELPSHGRGRGFESLTAHFPNSYPHASPFVVTL